MLRGVLHVDRDLGQGQKRALLDGELRDDLLVDVVDARGQGRGIFLEDVVVGHAGEDLAHGDGAGDDA
jgi:hypothetical protein